MACGAHQGDCAAFDSRLPPSRDGDYSQSMTRIGRYIFGQLFWTMVIVTISLACIVWLTQSLRFVEMVVNRGLSAPLFVYFTALLLPTFLGFILPIALFTAVVFVYNKLTLDSELVVLRAAGLSHRALAAPALILAVVTALTGYLLSIYLVPASYRAFKDMQITIRNNYSGVLLQEGVFNQLSKGITVYLRSRTPDGELLGIVVYDSRIPDKPVTMMAERGALVQGRQGPRVLMVNGNRQETNSSGHATFLHFERYVFDLGSAVEDNEVRWREPRERYLGELFIDGDADTTYNYHKLRMEGHYRLASPLLSITYGVIGLSVLLTGTFSRRGQLRRILFASGTVVVLQIGVLSVKNLAEKLPDMMPLLYACAVVPILVGFYFLLVPRRPRPTHRDAAGGAAAAG